MSTSSDFPLLKLPTLALEVVTSQMNFGNILDLSLSSKIFHSRLTALKFTIDSVEWILTRNHIGVTINSGFRAWEIRIESDSALKLEHKKLNGSPVSLAKYDCPFGATYWYLISENSDFDSKLKTLENLTEFLMIFLRCKRFELRYSLKQNLLSPDFFIWKYKKIKKWNSLSITGNHLHPLIMTPEDLHFLIDDLKSEKLTLDIKVTDPYFKYQGKLEVKELRVGDNRNNWLDLGSFCLNCAKINLTSSSEHLKPVNQVLKNWIQSKSLEILEHLAISKKEDIDSAKVLRGIECQETRFSISDFVQRLGLIYMGSVFRDIQREFDGRWGTVIINRKCLDFIVWTPEKLKRCCKETRVKFGYE